MTEDMIKQQADVFESLGTSNDAAQIRAKLQSAQLVSDMQAFKAANPRATLEDFVRWHSPKDWSGCLSARMSDPNNIWQQLWKVINYRDSLFSCDSLSSLLIYRKVPRYRERDGFRRVDKNHCLTYWPKAKRLSISSRLSPSMKYLACMYVCDRHTDRASPTKKGRANYL